MAKSLLKRGQRELGRSRVQGLGGRWAGGGREKVGARRRGARGDSEGVIALSYCGASLPGLGFALT